MMNNAIKLAIEKGGYGTKVSPNLTVTQVKLLMGGELNPVYLFQDPLFWQALGKALGWHRVLCYGCREPLADSDDEETLKACQAGEDMNMEEWRYYAMHYFDLVLAGGDTEQFWKDLLDSPKANLT